MIAVTALLLILAALFIIVGGLGWAGKLPGNGVIGIRVPEVRKTKELWDTAHRIAGPLWTVSGVVLALGGILSFGASGCGSCSLNGACEGGSDAFAAGESFGNVDLDAVRKAAAKGDDRQYGNTTVHP